MIDIDKTPIDDTLHIKPRLLGDDRGIFSRFYCKKTFSQAKLDLNIEQINNSSTKKAGTIRGLHYQIGAYQEVKLVRCISGSIFDVVADTRKESSTFGKWFGVILTAESREMLLVPKGIAHGFQCLEENTDVIYASSAEYNPDSERGLRWDDPFFKISWPIQKNIDISEKDKKWPNFNQR